MDNSIENNDFAKGLFFRIVLFTVMILAAFLAFRVSAFYGQTLIGAILMVAIFALGIVIYFVSMFYKRQVHKCEFLLSIVFVLVVTVLIYTNIYLVHSANKQDYFIVYGKHANLGFGDSFYFSMATIVTVGFGDIVPHGLFRDFAISEAFLGLVCLGIVIFYITKMIEVKKGKAE